MVKIITVHGTFAGDPSDEGEKWWQKGSEFLQKLQSCIAEPLDILPFHWSGANSELDRRKTGNRLWKTIKASEEKPILIGHSHGGSSSIHAAGDAILADSKNASDTLRGLVTIATPMFRFRTNRNPIARFNILGRVFALAAVSSVLISASYLGWDIDYAARQGTPYSLSQILMAILTNSGFWSAAIITAILWIYARKNHNRSKLYSKNGVWGTFAKKTLSLSHSQDEAIGALQQAQGVQPKLVTRTSIIAPLFGALAFVLVLLDFGSEVTQTIADEDHYYTEMEGAGIPRPLVFISDSEFSGYSALRFRPDISDLGEWRLFDIVGATKLRTREELAAISFDDIWFTEEVSEILASESGAWLRDARDQTAQNITIAYIPTDQVDRFKQAFAQTLEAAASAGQQTVMTDTAYSEFDSLTVDAGILQRLFSYGVTAEIDMPSAIIASVPSQYGYYNVGAETIPADTLFLGSSYTDYVKSFCDAEPDVVDAVGGLCSLFYDPGQSIQKTILWDFTSYKDALFDFIFLDLLGDQDSADRLYSLQYSEVKSLGLSVRILLAVTIAVVLSIAAGLLLAPFLNGFVVGTLRGNAYGNDGFGETLRDVHPGANFDGGRPGNLPKEIEEEMIANSLADAPAAIQRLRSLFGVAELASKDGHDPVALATKFEKSELIHNAYFHSDKFIKYLAAQMVALYGLTPTADLEEDEDGSRYLELARKA
ncbi:hypothetical protein [Parvularcula marina]|uniref:hypothetical protein n=1 Tax=Parvularcula marina TaxID=2292771 RepID=UPI0035143F64